MGGGLLQLVAYGAQDAYISGNPQITFWKGLFKRHTNFAMEPFRVNLSGEAAWGVKHSAILGRHADLLYSTYLEVVLPGIDSAGNVVTWNNDQGRLGYNMLKYVELDIGGQVIDRQYGEFLYLWDSLTSSQATSTKLWNMVGGGAPASGLNGSVSGDSNASVSNGTAYAKQVLCNAGSGRPSLPSIIYIPLYFFYTRNPGAALPLIALQYHEVKINVLWNNAQYVAGDFTKATSLPQPTQASVYVDYIYLDTEERRRMAQQSHEYLIEQTQYNEDKGISSFSNRIDLTFNHPVKELIWVVQPSYYNNCHLAQSRTTPITRLQPFTYNNSNVSPGLISAGPVYEQWIQINGQDRLDKRYGDYFNKVQLYQHHSGVGGTMYGATTSINTPAAQDSGYYVSGTSSSVQPAQTQPGIYCYSFALRPEEHQPSGTCNFSRIDTATIVMTIDGAEDLSSHADANGNDNNWDVRVYAINYNILRVMSGMGGLAYSN